MLAYLPAALIWAALALHLQGERRAAIITGRSRSARARWRAASFYAGLATILVALLSPIDSLSQKLFWVHMLQHVLLLAVAAPLIVAGAPWMSIWRPLPLGARRAVAGTLARSPAFAPVRAVAGALSRPLGAWLAFNLGLVVWHVPAVYDLALRNAQAHVVEHLWYLVFGVLLWAQVIESPPLRMRLRSASTIFYMTSTLVVGWALSLLLAFAPAPLYPAYTDVADRPGGISALADQRLAGVVMLGLGSVSMIVYGFVLGHRRVGRGRAGERSRRGATATLVSYAGDVDGTR